MVLAPHVRRALSITKYEGSVATKKAANKASFSAFKLILGAIVGALVRALAWRRLVFGPGGYVSVQNPHTLLGIKQINAVWVFVVNCWNFVVCGPSWRMLTIRQWPWFCLITTLLIAWWANTRKPKSVFWFAFAVIFLLGALPLMGTIPLIRLHF